ncbi:MAG: hypothetical protein PUP91_28230 [Rhizonema sp. PD37]|nr:hypothetical protein [Rhizonema sp. PD37]
MRSRLYVKIPLIVSGLQCLNQREAIALVSTLLPKQQNNDLQQFSGKSTTVVGANGCSPLQTVWFMYVKTDLTAKTPRTQRKKVKEIDNFTISKGSHLNDCF